MFSRLISNQVGKDDFTKLEWVLKDETSNSSTNMLAAKVKTKQASKRNTKLKCMK